VSHPSASSIREITSSTANRHAPRVSRRLAGTYHSSIKSGCTARPASTSLSQAVCSAHRNERADVSRHRKAKRAVR
jgi:hypothetical protein